MWAHDTDDNVDKDDNDHDDDVDDDDLDEDDLDDDEVDDDVVDDDDVDDDTVDDDDVHENNNDNDINATVRLGLATTLVLISCCSGGLPLNSIWLLLKTFYSY